MPSFTFVSTANAFVLRGAVPVFVDIRSDTLNLDEQQIEAAITPRTRAIVPVHYAGVALRDGRRSCEIAARHGLLVIEDAAQAIMSTYYGSAARRHRAPRRLQFPRDQERHLGRGRRAPDQRSARIRSAPRSSGRRAPTAASSSAARWTSTPGSTSARRSCPGEIVAAFLWAQLEQADASPTRRLAAWERYHAAFASSGDVRAACVARSSRTVVRQQRPHVLPPVAGPRGANLVHRAHEAAGDTVRVSLRAAAFLAHGSPGRAQ